MDFFRSLDLDWLLKGLEPGLVLKSVGTVIAAVIGVLRGRKALPKSRTRLKTDLEILSLLDKDDPDYQIVKHRISRRIEEIYPTKTPARSSKEDIIASAIAALALALAAIFAVWTFYHVRAGSWWGLLPGLFTFIVLVWASQLSGLIS